MSEVVWKEVYGYEGLFEVSNMGRVKNLKNGFMYPIFDAPECSTPTAPLVDSSGNKKNVLIHRIVAIAFLGRPPKDKPYVNHKNGHSLDNRLENLEWCDQSHNVRHGFALAKLRKYGVDSVSAYADFNEIYRQAKELAMPKEAVK